MKTFEIKNKGYRKLLPLFSFFMILTVSVFLSGSAKLPEKNLNGFSQLKNIRLSYKFENIELCSALKRISLDYNVKIYTENDLAEKVSACFFNSSLEEAMAALLKGLDYNYKFYGDGVLIEKKRNFNIKSAARNKLNMKRVFVSPSFISISKVREIIEANKSAEATVNYDEKSSIAILDETPDNADYILNKIREADRISEKYDNAASDISEPEGKIALETKMFSLKNIQIKTIIDELRQKLSKSGSAYENEKINAVIVTDTALALKNIETFIASKEISNSATLINFKIAAVPLKIVNELGKIGYNLQCKDGENIKCLRASNKNEALGMIQPYVKFSDKMAALKNDFIEVDTNYEILKSKIKIFPAALENGAFRINLSVLESLFIDSENSELQNIMSISSSRCNEIFENECLLITGIGKKNSDFLACGNSYYINSGRYLPGMANMASQCFNGHERNSENSEKLMFVIVIEAAPGRSNKGLPKYSYVNLTKFKECTANSGNGNSINNTEFAISGGGSYLEIFGGAKEKNNSLKIENNASLKTEKNINVNTADTAKNKDEKIFISSETPIRIKSQKSLQPDPLKNDSEKKSIEIADKAVNEEAALKNKLDSAGTAPKEDVIKTVKKMISEGKFLKAKKTVSEYVETNPDNCEAFIMLGNINRELKNFVSAKKSWEQALKLSPDNAKLKENVEKLENLIGLIKSEKAKAVNDKQIKEFENYLR
ncbi:MAG: hypothetical protein QMC67_07840 [Candidatus Wallbacteria bacterium]